MNRLNYFRQNFLQQHYNRYRDAGGYHVEYIVWNDLDDNSELCRELRENYEVLKGRATEKNEHNEIEISSIH